MESTSGLRALAVVAVLLGGLPLTAAMSARCARANAGRSCFVCNKGPADVLLGHYGRIESMEWRGENAIWALSVSAPQHGYKERAAVPFDVTDGDANLAEALRWIREHPRDALVLSCEHVYDLFGSLPVPGVDGPAWAAMEASHFAFVALLLFPSALLGYDLIRTGGVRRLLRGPELLLGAPVFGLMMAAFVATGEARYRIPFDPIFILLAIQFYRRLGGSTPASALPRGA